MDLPEVLEKKQHNQDGARPLLNATARRVLVYVVVLLAVAVFAWALIQGDERNLWSTSATGAQLLGAPLAVVL